MRTTTMLSAGLFVAWAVHDAEELITMAETSRRVLPRAPRALPVPDALRAHGLSQTHVNVSVGLMAVPVAAASILGVRTGGRSRWFQGAVVAFGLHGFSHLGSSVALRGYTTGVATAPVTVIPYWLLARRVLSRHGLRNTDRATTLAALAWLPITVGVHVLARRILGEKSAAPHGAEVDLSSRRITSATCRSGPRWSPPRPGRHAPARRR